MIAVENHRLVLNDFLQSVSNRNVYAAGDGKGSATHAGIEP